MAIGGIAEIFFGVKAEQQQLEDIAEPLTAEGGRGRARREPGEAPTEEAARAGAPQPRAWPLRLARRCRSSRPFPAVALHREVEIIDRALQDSGSANRRELGRRVGARYWGPGRFHAALREAVVEGRVKRLRGGQYAPVTGNDT